jgi:hypothetical protein
MIYKINPFVVLFSVFSFTFGEEIVAVSSTLVTFEICRIKNLRRIYWIASKNNFSRSSLAFTSVKSEGSTENTCLCDNFS